MIDTKLLLNDFDFVSNNLSKRNIDPLVLSSLRDFVSMYKAFKIKTESKQAEQNKLSKQYGELIKNKVDSETIKNYKNKLDLLKEEIKNDTIMISNQEAELHNMLLRIPNLLDSNTPFGQDESDNVEIKQILEPKKFDFKPKEHWELAEQNKWIDFDAGVKLAKSRFSVLRNEGARLNHALISYMLDFNRKNGFEICSVPIIVNEQAMMGTGQLPKFADDMFRIDNTLDAESERGHNLYLISTSEISLTNLYQGEIIKVENLPIMLTAYTPCFRKEAGSAGRDTRGIIRQHQFDKVELVAITTQEQSINMQQCMIENASRLLESLGLPHRLVQLCSGDIGFSACNTVDLEVWLPGQNCYREISSVSNCGDFQARRAKIRYKEDGKNKLVHTLNGSSLAVGRTLVAIMENFQQADGSIEIPKVLQKYL
ncbi:serine--tRNA ligase [Helicobacter didelphidarum]|uniref:Serine--tRNA ligase n=1 Tax=Helicobacter didelphidarum TaxID=2040648 RepID=A0A3D8IJ29_9HELI|nr:serine--tRNA ligase [Helicobacter didelphidarum]RDU65337.1 serine--tRNA ligase [Helicobacter didelphidarum]